MSYKVLARKWRPDHFDEVVGQEHVAQTLINSIEQDRVAHSYLFCGARGVGKTSTARILAKAMNCEQGPTARPCYNCSSCDEISNGQSVDVFEIDGASNRGINEIRELRDGVRYAPSRDEYKIYIIDEVHMLTKEAFNALLKTLEEPPPHAKFIFATTEPQKIPVTILSRCQRFDFKRISQRDIVAHLEQLCEHEGLEAERSALQVIARQANGGMRDALSLLDQIISFSGQRITEKQITEILGVANRKHLFELSEAVLAGDTERALLVLDDVNRFGYDLQQFASELVTHFRDLMVTAVVKEPDKVTQLTESELAIAREQVDGHPSELLHRHFTVMADGAEEMSRSGHPKLIFEMTLVRLAELEPMMNLDLLVDRLQLLESTLEGDAGDVAWPDTAGTDAAEVGSTKVAEEEPAEEKSDDKAEVVKQVDEDEPPDDPGGESSGKSRARDSSTTDSAEESRAEEKNTADKKQAEVVPQMPERLRPDRSDSAERPDVSGLDTPEERWRAVVEYLRTTNAPVAATCEYAYLEGFDDEQVHLTFGERYVDLAGDDERVEALERAVRELFGEAWSVRLERRGDDPTDKKTLAQEREEDIQRRRAALASQLRENSAVKTAQELFDADEPRISVKLYDE